MDTSKQEIDIRAVVSWGAEGAYPGFENLTTSLDIVKGFHIIELKLLQLLLAGGQGGLAGWALAHPEFGSSVNPITGGPLIVLFLGPRKNRSNGSWYY